MELTFSQEQQMVVVAIPLGNAVRSQIGFDPDDRREVAGPGSLVPVENPVHDAVVGDRDMPHLELASLGHVVVDATEPIEQRVLGVQVQMDER